jgi:ATP-dependent Clp protease ATP-binding subunit ClpB
VGSEEEDEPAASIAEEASPGIAPEVRQQVMAAVKRHFRPEFLNRLDDIVIFQPLSKGQLRSIMRLQMGAIAQRLQDRNIGIELTDAGVQYVMDHAYDPLYGARPIRRFLEKAVTTHVSRMLIGGELDRDQTLKIDASEDGSQLAFRVVSRPSPLSASGAAAAMDVDGDDNPAPSFFRPSPGRGK